MLPPGSITEDDEAVVVAAVEAGEAAEAVDPLLLLGWFWLFSPFSLSLEDMFRKGGS